MKNFIYLLSAFCCNFCFADTIKIKMECNSELTITLTSGVDILHNALHKNTEEIIIQYQQKTDELIRLVLDSEIYYIIPKKLTRIKALCGENGYKLHFCNKEDKFYNDVSTTGTFRKKNFELAYKLAYDSTLAVSQQDSIRKLMGTMRAYRDSIERFSMLAHAPSKASLYFLNYNFSDKYYSKKYFIELYKKITFSKKIRKAHPTIINEIGKKLSLQTYTINDTISISEANAIFLTEKNKDVICVFITGQCHATQPNLAVLEEKQLLLQNKGVKVNIIITYTDEVIEAICKKNNWAYHIYEQLRETDFAYKLWNSSSFSTIHFSDKKIVSMANNIADLKW